MRRRESRRRSRHNRTSKSPAMWPGFLAAQIVREYSLLLIFLCKIFPEKLDKARGGRRGILDSPFQSTPPRGGATCACGTASRRCRHFNPRPPRGGRLQCNIAYAILHSFQSTPPRGGATSATASSFVIVEFQSTPPRGGRLRRLYLQHDGEVFQSTPPARGATPPASRPVSKMPISSHAPREGGDGADDAF